MCAPALLDDWLSEIVLAGLFLSTPSIVSCMLTIDYFKGTYEN